MAVTAPLDAVTLPKADQLAVEEPFAKVLVAEIEAGGPDDDLYDAKVTVLSEQITRHLEEEETWVVGMFGQARKAGLEVDALGERMAEEKQALQARGKRQR